MGIDIPKLGLPHHFAPFAKYAFSQSCMSQNGSQ